MKAQGYVEQGAFVGDGQAEDLTSKLGHGPHLYRLTEPSVATLRIVTLPIAGWRVANSRPAMYGLRGPAAAGRRMRVWNNLPGNG